MISRYTFSGRRQASPRRLGEPTAIYVDRLGQGISILLVLIFFFHCLDAMFTLSHLSHGGRELNPFMGFLIRHGSGVFVGTKLAMAGGGLCFLGIHKNFPMVKAGIVLLFLLYAAVIGYHVLLLCQS